MNANQIINMIMRTVMRRVINKGINAGIDVATRKRGGTATPGPDTKEDAKRAKQAMRVTRRMGRF